MIKELPKTYEPKEVESKIYKFWEKNNFFKADANSEKPPFSIVIPPPNVTGVLHMGHALNGALHDILIRHKKMCGYEVLWLPGTDHAGIATQNVVEKELRKDGVSRHDIGREEFLEYTWEWANTHKSKILEQFKRLGASFDLSRERFTLDEGCSKAVKEVFVNLYNKGLIYKGKYIVNWCPRCMSAISDIETDYLTEQGNLWEISYPVKDDYGAIVVATTRPETMFGDVAVAVNPNDLKYKDLIGRQVVVPIIGRAVPVIADEAVEMGFGTGALKITPAHDPNDYEIAKRHGLSPIWIMDEQGYLLKDENVPYELRGVERYEAREKTLELLKIRGEFIRAIPHEHNVGHCQRCDSTIEPLLSEQWFVKMPELAEKPIQAVEKGELNFVPERWTKIYLDWMKNVREWCISRQLWWGHQIPAYYCDGCSEMIVAVEKPEQCTKCASSNLKQDPDVLDTWFSSALWPFSTMGWPNEEAKDFQKFYPTSVLVTAFDIIFFWVARMVTMGYEFTDEAPFETVYIHGLIRDEKGQKMSKSKGNTIDPVEIIDKYGCDALRFTLTSLVTYGGQDIKVSDERFEYGRNFANKVWNASRFVMMNLEGVDDRDINMSFLTIADRWILHKYNEAVFEVNKNLEGYKFGETTQILYEFFWNSFCDWYVEIAKTQLNDTSKKLNTQRILKYVLDGTMRMLHPIMPHITEEIWGLLNGKASGSIDKKYGKDTIIYTEFPQFDMGLKDENAENRLTAAIDVIKAVRNIRQSFNIPIGSSLNLNIYSESIPQKETYELVSSYIENFAKIERINIKFGLPKEPPSACAGYMTGNSLISVPLAGLIDVQKEILRQNKKLEALAQEKKALDSRFNSPKFLENAPKEVISQTRERLKEIEQQAQAVGDLLKSLNS